LIGLPSVVQKSWSVSGPNTIRPTRFDPPGAGDGPGSGDAAATPQQPAIPAVDYLIGQGRKRFFLLGTDTVYPRTTNAILKSYLNAQGVADEDVAEFYTPFNHKNWEEVVTWIRRFGASGDAAIVTTVSGDANIYFYRELGRQGITAESLPAMTLSIGEGELPAIADLRWPATSPPGAICTRSTAPRTKLSSLPGGVSATRPMS